MLAIKVEELEFSAVKHPRLQALNLSTGWWGLGRKPGLTEDRRAAVSCYWRGKRSRESGRP